jgi:DNA-directed RNA polymerase subunit RPC12/RpoP
MGDADSSVAVTNITTEEVEAMIVAVLKCQMCGAKFEAEMLDRDDSNERHRHGSPIRCPRCNSTEIEVLRTVRRLRSAG